MKGHFLHAAVGALHFDAEVVVQGPDGFYRKVETVASFFDPDAIDNHEDPTPTIVLAYSDDPPDERIAKVAHIAKLALADKRSPGDLRLALTKILAAIEAKP